MPITRRAVLSGAAATAAAPAPRSARSSLAPCPTETVPLDGGWRFVAGDSPDAPTTKWTGVRLPHTWQVDPSLAGYMGLAWYRRQFTVPEQWRSKFVRIEFEAVYHSARVWVNGRLAGDHARKGYTAFTLDLMPYLKFGAENTILVRVDNSFTEDMAPRGKSFDWSPDGGLYRPVNLHVTPRVFVESVAIDAFPDLNGSAALEVSVTVRNEGPAAIRVPVSFDVLGAALKPAAVQVSVPAHAADTVALKGAVDRPRLWHFDDPHLYSLTATAGEHTHAATFGIRRFEVRDSGFYLNGERVRLMGVERMAGSHPDCGMAEPAGRIEHDHRDMKELNCVFTRVHWPQDRRVLDYCDRHGILIQTEVPAWGPDTFKGMGEEPSRALVRNGIEQLREMIARDRNHPSICSWGLCNEVNGQNPAAQKFVRALAAEARRLDPRRPLTYASHSLSSTPERDVAGELDFVSWNEYYESWQAGTVETLREKLDGVRRAFPSRPIVISEYGFCECAPAHVGGDPRREQILKTHTALFRERDSVAGVIFFDYNDYRTHVGDKGLGVLKQRVHGVVDLYGNRKPSFAALAGESSPVEALTIVPQGHGLAVRVRARNSIPAYTLRGYTLRWIVFRDGGIPVEQHDTMLGDLAPGAEKQVEVAWQEPQARKVVIEVRRPTGFAAAAVTHVPA